MENTESKPQSGMFKPALIHAVMISAVLIIYTLILYLAGQLQNTTLTWVSTAISFAGILYALFSYRNQNLGGYITYGKAILYGLVVGLMIGIFTGIFTYLLYGVISPELVEEARLLAETEMYRANPNLSSDQADMALKMQYLFVSPVGLLVASIFGGAIQGLIFGLIGGLFVKKKDPDAFM